MHSTTTRFMDIVTSRGGGTKILVCDKTEIEIVQDLLGGGTFRRDLSAPVILAHDINSFKIYVYLS